jgi:hypothetical protein
VTVTQQGQSRSPGPLAWIGLRVALRVAALLALALGVYAWTHIARVETGPLVIGWAIIVVLPYALGALTQLFIHVPDIERKMPSWVSPLTVVGVVLGLGALILREGVICIVMLAPIWIIAALFGSISVTNLHDVFKERHRTGAFVLAILPFAAVFMDASMQQPIERFSVSRDVVITADASEIWPQLLELDGLAPADGVWNFTQDVLGVPRPSSAVVVGEGVGSVRQARWGDDIRFEERITDWQLNEKLAWNFAFPDDSISRYTDPHIHPDGQNLKIESGSYRLTPMPHGKTRLTLETRYLARTPVNLYAAMWGELALGDIQTNILAIVKKRAERLK